jgi:hypothetical protein
MSFRATIQLNNENTIPQFGLGTWLSKPHEVENSVCQYIRPCRRVNFPVGRYRAVETRYRHIDCAYVYGNQDEVRLLYVPLFIAMKQFGTGWCRFEKGHTICSAARRTLYHFETLERRASSL